MIWAPPVHVPSADGFATAPVSSDAVLLTTAHVDPAHRGGGLGRMLVQGMAKDLVKRGGVRAVEAFGDTRGRTGRCVVPADFLLSVGFSTVRAHAVNPRMRMDLRTTLSLREELEKGLERLLAPVSGKRAATQRGSGAAVEAHRTPSAQHTSAAQRRKPSRISSKRQHAGAGVDVGGEVEALHRHHDRLRQQVAEGGVVQPRGVGGVGQVAGVEAHRGHPGVAQQLPGLGVGAQVEQVGAGDDLALHESREPLAGRGPGLRCPRRRRSTSRRRTRRGWWRRRGPARRTGRRRCGWRTPARSTPRRAPRPSAGVVRKAWTPVATRRPSTRPARSCRIASEASACSSGRWWPRPTSITTILPPRWGPASRMCSWARSALGAPPLTIGESRRSALKVAGPQVPSGGMPKLRWNSRTPASVSGPK